MYYFAAIFFLFFTQTTIAGIFFEPYVGYKSESIKLTDLLNTKTEIDATSPDFGLKLGFRSALGIDLNIAGEFSSGNASISLQPEKNKFNHKTASVQLGVNALGLVKMYLGSTFLNEFTLEDSSSLLGFKLSGPSFHAGLQYRLFSYLNLGLQYSLNQFNSIEGTAYSGSTNTESYFSKIDAQDYSFYLSITF